MGLFGFMNYNKEGPGVSKNEPEKKSFARFFELFFGNFWKLVTISLLQGLLSIPVITSGLADVGAANVTRNISRGKHSFGVQDFFDTIKKNWKQALGMGTLNIIITAVLVFDVWYFFDTKGTTGIILMGIVLFLLFVFTIMKYYIPLLIITFSLSVKQIYRNSFKFVFISFFKNLLIFAINLICTAIGGLLIYFGGFIGIVILSVVAVFVYPAFRSLLIQFVIFDSIRKYMIDPYYAEHPEADIQRRLDLGLEVPEEYMPKYDNILFSDEQILNKDEE